MPTYNEAANVPHVLAQLPPDVELVVVDGHSTDGTVAVTRALRPDATIVHQNRRGRGNALVCGFTAATGDIIVTLDADGSADPGEIPLFVAALIGGADVAHGSRFRDGGSSGRTFRAWGDHLISRSAAALFGTVRTDLCYGYTAIWARCLPALHLSPSVAAECTGRVGDGFDFVAVLEARTARARLRVVEVPSVEQQRRWGESCRRAWRDGARVMFALLVERVTAGSGPPPSRRLMPLSATCAWQAAPGRGERPQR
jgi:glycosyltransferase involved in cell wall biosynthesis